MSAIDEFHAAVIEWADNLGLEGDERDNYIDFCMEKANYKRATTWLPPDQDAGNSGGGSGGLFGGGPKGPAKRQGGGQRSKPQGQGGQRTYWQGQR